MGLQFAAEVAVIRTDAGGRVSPISSDYRGLMRVTGSGDLFDVVLFWRDFDAVPPGGAGLAFIRVPGTAAPRVSPRTPFELFEGPKLVATGTVVAV